MVFGFLILIAYIYTYVHTSIHTSIYSDIKLSIGFIQPT